MGWLLPILSTVWGAVKSLFSSVAASVGACAFGIAAVIKTDTNMVVKALCLALMFISSLVIIKGILVAYAYSCAQIVTAVSFKDVPFFANVVATVAMLLITFVFCPVLAKLIPLSTTILPAATLLALGYREEASLFYNSVMSLPPARRLAIQD